MMWQSVPVTNNFCTEKRLPNSCRAPWQEQFQTVSTQVMRACSQLKLLRPAAFKGFLTSRDLKFNYCLIMALSTARADSEDYR